MQYTDDVGVVKLGLLFHDKRGVSIGVPADTQVVWDDSKLNGIGTWATDEANPIRGELTIVKPGEGSLDGTVTSGGQSFNVSLPISVTPSGVGSVEIVEEGA